MRKIYAPVLGVLMMFGAVQHTQAQELTHYDNKNYVEGEMLVQMRSDASFKALLSNAPSNYKVKLVKQLSRPMRIWLIEFDNNVVSHRDFQAYLYNQQSVSVADYNYEIQMRATLPNDASFTQQWHHNNTGQTGGTTDADIDSDLAWDITTGGQTATNDDIVVCLIESGNLDHQDITANRWINTAEIAGNGIDDDGNGYIDDISGWNPVANNGSYGTGAHGTNCLGMIGAKGDNSLNVVGANWDVKLMVVGGYSISTQANAIEAYTYPLEMRQLWNNTNGVSGAFVVATSSSWGIDQADPSNYPLWCQFYDTLGHYGILNVGATTNSNLDVDAVGDMPTACNSDYMIGVGRTDHNDNTAGGYGQNTIELGAPGIDVVTTANTNTITTTTGTSFSCPLTAGVIGLAYSIPCTDFMTIVMNDPQQGADLVRQALLDGVDPKANLATKFNTGGRLNSRNTLDELMAVACTGNLCLSPGSISTTSVTDVSADITFTPFGSATEQLLYWREVGQPTYTLVSNATSPASLTGLTGCTDYEFYMRSVCGTDTSSNSNVVTFSTTGCGNCIDLSYCPSTATDGADEWIEEFQLDAYTNTSGNNQGYGDFTTSGSIALDMNVAYNVTITPGWGGTLYNEYSRVWIDLNQDGTFDAAELLYDQGAATQTAATGTITIPGTALPGNTRLRVQLAYQGGSQSTLPSECGNFTWGEVEDYCVDITNPTPCGTSVVSTVVDPTCDVLADGSIAVAVSGGTAPYTYELNGASASNNNAGLIDGTYTLVVSDDTGCDTTIMYTLTNTTDMSVTASGSNISCNGLTDGSATASASGSSGYSYQWVGGPASDTYTNMSAGTYTVDVTDGQGCTASANVTITEPSADVVNFGSTTNFLSVTFTNSSTAGSYSWDLGDGNTSALTAPTHVYSAPGTYTVCLTLTTSCGETTNCETVTVVDNDAAIGENDANSTLLFPNPAQNVVTLSTTNTSAASIELVDVLGQIVLTQKVNSEITEIALKKFETGTYIYFVKDSEGKVLHSDKLIIKK